MIEHPLLVIGPPRSGTSITARILQAHIADQFPFEINRHAEPEELISIETAFMERNGKDWIDRLYFEDMVPDLDLFEQIVAFFKRYHTTPCVIKSPIFSIISNWIQIPLQYKTVYVYRSEEGMAGSLMYHKNFTEAQAKKAAKWYYKEAFKLRGAPNFKSILITFSKDKERFLIEMKRATEYCGLEFDERIFNKYWDETQIEYYKQDDSN